MKILPVEELHCRLGPAQWFTGTVWIDEIVASSAPSHFKANRVTFAPGARSFWHTHPRGQALHVVEGMGWVQLRGKEPLPIRPGDTVWIEAGEVHWHGATAGRTMVHLAIQEADENGAEVAWLEQVSDEEYPKR